MITLTQTESTLSLSANIRPKGYEGAEFVPEGLTVEVVGRNNGALLQHLNGNIEGDRLSVDIDLDDVQDVDIYDLVINYRLRDARYIRGYRAVNIIETAFEARRSENTSILGGGNTARATVITPVASEGANASQGAGAVDFSALSPEQIEALKQALGVNTAAGSGADINSLLTSEVNIEEVFGSELGPTRDFFFKDENGYNDRKTLANAFIRIGSLVYHVDNWLDEAQKAKLRQQEMSYTIAALDADKASKSDMYSAADNINYLKEEVQRLSAKVEQLEAERQGGGNSLSAFVTPNFVTPNPESDTVIISTPDNHFGYVNEPDKDKPRTDEESAVVKVPEPL